MAEKRVWLFREGNANMRNSIEQSIFFLLSMIGL